MQTLLAANHLDLMRRDLSTKKQQGRWLTEDWSDNDDAQWHADRGDFDISTEPTSYVIPLRVALAMLTMQVG